jgi:bifunctional non-homologous end joining protein LigD
LVAYALASFPPAPIPFQAPGFIVPCQPALADRPPSGPDWLNEIKFDGYRIIARKGGEQVRLWARTTSDYSKAFPRVRDAVAALPIDSAAAISRSKSALL